MNNKKFVMFTVVAAFVIAVIIMISGNEKQFELKFYKTYKINEVPKIGDRFSLGGFSDLFYYNKHLYTITDRGPNTDSRELDGKTIRNFPLNSSYNPYLVEFKLEDNGFAKISRSRNLSLSGLPVSENRDCIPLDKEGNPIDFDPYGVDSEALVVDKNSHFWVGDEYIPSIIEFDKNLNVLNRFAPSKSNNQLAGITYNLPEEFSNIQKNLGFESIAYDGNENIFVFTQGPLKNGHHVKVFKFNIATKKVEQTYSYNIGENSIVSAATCISPTEIITAERRNGEHQIRILHLVPKIVNKSKLVISLKGMHNINKYNKIEGIAYDGNDNVYVINDNDFSIDEENRPDSFIMSFKIVK